MATWSHPEMVGDMSCVTYQKFLLCISSLGQDLYAHQKLNMYIYWFLSESGYIRRRQCRTPVTRGRTIIGSVSNRGRYLSIGIGSDRGVKYLAYRYTDTSLYTKWWKAVRRRRHHRSVCINQCQPDNSGNCTAGSGEGGGVWCTPDWASPTKGGVRKGSNWRLSQLQ